MSKSLAHLSLFAATWEQTIESRKRTYPQWGRGLTEEQYRARDSQMDPMEHAAEGKLVTWVLAPRESPTTLDFKCSCETYRRKGLVKRPGSSTVEEVFGYGIASVFTPPQNRGQGYARHMMRLLHWVLAPRNEFPAFPETWGAPPPLYPGCGDASFSALYSDVGDEFYRHAGPDETSEGWIVRDPKGTIWDVAQDLSSLSSVSANGLSVQWLNEDGCKELWKNDAELMRNDLSGKTSNSALFTFLPDEGVGAFLVRRTMFFLPGWTSHTTPSKWGVKIVKSDESGGGSVMPTFATFTIDVIPAPSTLIVTRLRATEETFPLLAASLLHAGSECGVEKVEVWNLPKPMEDIAHSLNGKTETRNEHLNAFKWYGLEKSGDIEWLFNEKFCWC
ncbi:hypothetical protein SCHPADRAFT_828329 [Schizopora paradoxa]|uniref:LYC1 C-terminal domain-containing protein n=1 Tax=Schizopora paradoxa TaxID=27342 RepID=A0A0H2S8P8_9AGAM|nr:hypothetical protein SCHPADRAFT_828329 [Schizopora paradoxa]